MCQKEEPANNLYVHRECRESVVCRLLLLMHAERLDEKLLTHAERLDEKLLTHAERLDEKRLTHAERLDEKRHVRWKRLLCSNPGIQLPAHCL